MQRYTVNLLNKHYADVKIWIGNFEKTSSVLKEIALLGAVDLNS